MDTRAEREHIKTEPQWSGHSSVETDLRFPRAGSPYAVDMSTAGGHPAGCHDAGAGCHDAEGSCHDADGGGGACEHGWRTESRHRISTGTIVYVRCVRCETRRVDHLGESARVPDALSRTLIPGALAGDPGALSREIGQPRG